MNHEETWVLQAAKCCGVWSVSVHHNSARGDCVLSLLPRRETIPCEWQVESMQNILRSLLTWPQDVLASPPGGWLRQTALGPPGTNWLKEKWLFAILSWHLTWQWEYNPDTKLEARITWPSTTAAPGSSPSKEEAVTLPQSIPPPSGTKPGAISITWQ